MDRILISQSEKNDGTNYTVINGVLSNNEFYARKMFIEITGVESTKMIFKNDFLTVEKKDDFIYFTSSYIDEDNVGRKISYMYKINKSTSFREIIKLLQFDSKIINRQLDSKKILQIVELIEKDKKLQNKINQIILLSIIGIVVFASILYFTKKEIKLHKNESKSTRSSVISK